MPYFGFRSRSMELRFRVYVMLSNWLVMICHAGGVVLIVELDFEDKWWGG